MTALTLFGLFAVATLVPLLRVTARRDVGNLATTR